MTVLCDRDIRHAIDRGDLDITPRPLEAQLQPASIDLSLANDFLLPKPDQVVSFANGRPKIEYDRRTGPIWLEPGGFMLGRTQEIVKVGVRYRGKAEGKSTNGRAGLGCHVTAGFLDPGFEGTVTLELFNVAPYGIEVAPGMMICQVEFTLLTGVPDRVYGCKSLGSHYQGQRDTTGAR